jgi:CBS domain containing-hemolysin-like protein
MTAGVLIILLLAIAILIYGSAFFSGLETALFSLKPHQIRRLEKNHPSLSSFINLFRENPRRVLNVLLLGDAFVNVPLIVLCLFLLWESSLERHVPQWLAAIVIFAIVVLLCDLIPKLLALAAPYRLSTFGVFILRYAIPWLDRVGRALENLSSVIVEKITPLHLQKRARLSDAELETLVEIGEEEGTLHEAEGEMIQEIIKLGDKSAKDCMTPRVDTFTLPDDLTNEAAIAQLKERRHLRVPVYSDTPDQIVGIIDVKSFLLNPAEHYTETLLNPSFVPETMRAMDLLRGFLSHPQGWPSWWTNLGELRESSRFPTSSKRSSVMPRRSVTPLFILSRSIMDVFWLAATRASTICENISGSRLKPKASIRSVASFSIGSDIFPLPARN